MRANYENKEYIKKVLSNKAPTSFLVEDTLLVLNFLISMMNQKMIHIDLMIVPNSNMSLSKVTYSKLDKMTYPNKSCVKAVFL